MLRHDSRFLCAGLQLQLLRGGQAVFRKVAFYLPMEAYRFAGEFVQLLLVDGVHGVAAGGKGDIHILFRLLDGGAVAGVEQLEVGRPSCVGADMVEHAHKHGIGLPVHFGEFDGDQFDLAEHPGREEIGGGVEAVQDFPFIAFHHRFQLEDIAHKQKLLAAEGFPEVV